MLKKKIYIYIYILDSGTISLSSVFLIIKMPFFFFLETTWCLRAKWRPEIWAWPFPSVSGKWSGKQSNSKRTLLKRRVLIWKLNGRIHILGEEILSFFRVKEITVGDCFTKLMRSMCLYLLKLNDKSIVFYFQILSIRKNCFPCIFSMFFTYTNKAV